MCMEYLTSKLPVLVNLLLDWANILLFLKLGIWWFLINRNLSLHLSLPFCRIIINKLSFLFGRLHVCQIFSTHGYFFTRFPPFSSPTFIHPFIFRKWPMKIIYNTIYQNMILKIVNNTRSTNSHILYMTKKFKLVRR